LARPPSSAGAASAESSLYSDEAIQTPLSSPKARSLRRPYSNRPESMKLMSLDDGSSPNGV